MITKNISPGILIIGGEGPSSSNPRQSVEFWSDTEESCVLNNYPKYMDIGPTAQFVSDQLIACYTDSCEIYTHGFGWNHLVQTTTYRKNPSSAQNGTAMLLIGASGGSYNKHSTEWIPVDGSPAQPGTFNVRHGSAHCTIQLSSNHILLTGGYETEDYVTGYQLDALDGEMTLFNGMKHGRWGHACGAYQAGGQQVNFSILFSNVSERC